MLIHVDVNFLKNKVSRGYDIGINNVCFINKIFSTE